MNQKHAKLRVCASCEWVFYLPAYTSIGCPKCGFAHYGARGVYGNKCYRYAKTQEPWLERKISDYKCELLKQIPVCKSRPNYKSLKDCLKGEER